MTKVSIPVLIVAFGLVGCAGLRQFPKVTQDPTAALAKLDKDYLTAVQEIYDTQDSQSTNVDAAKAKAIRQRFIEIRMAVIDTYFRKFQAGLVKEHVGVDFGAAVLGVGVGAAGSLVAETASQILSAVSGGLAGAQAAYGKSVLYDKALSALLAQMQAGRKVIAAQIYQRWDQDIVQYPMWMAKTDLEAYYFAGSLPGAILGTAADAKVKEGAAEAELRLRPITTEAVSQSMIDRRAALNRAIEGLGVKAKDLVLQIETLAPGRQTFAEAKQILDDQYPANARDADTDGKKAITVLKRAVLHAATGGKIARDSANRVVVRALDGISFEIREGDRVGLIGDNGAGKTSLLRTLSGIYEPLEGRLETRGRIVTLLDFSFGIDPESTGYDNILLRGIMAGLHPREIRSKIEEIAEFTELGDYLQMPVRTYSTGMQLRLAFAASTSVEADILLMDEWLSVGDEAFSEKASRRLHDLVHRSSILVMASHSLKLIEAVCNRVFRLERGRIVEQSAIRPEQRPEHAPDYLMALARRGF